MKKSVSIIIPAYKEENSIEKVLLNIINEFNDELVFEIIVVIDKARNDKTYDIVKNVSEKFSQIRVSVREKKQGVAKAIVDGIKRSQNEIIIIAMADGSEDAKELKKLAIKMNDGFDTVYGNRFLYDSKIENYPLGKFVFNRLCNFVIRSLFGIPSNDITNAAKAYKSEILKNIEISSIGFEVFAELPIKAYLSGYKNIAEIHLTHKVGIKKESKFTLKNEGFKYIRIILSCFFKRHNLQKCK